MVMSERLNKSMNSSRLLSSSNKESDSSAQTSSGTTDVGTLEETKNQIESSVALPVIASSPSLILNESADSEGVTFKHHPLLDLDVKNSDQLPQFEEVGISDVVNEKNKIADVGKLEETKNQIESSVALPVIASSPSLILNESADSEGVTFKYHPLLDLDVKNSDQLPQFEEVGISDVVNEKNKIAVTPIRPQFPMYGSLYYKPPQYQNCSLSASTVETTCCIHQECTPASITSPASFFTPPSVKSNGLSLHSPEYILRFAASTFTNASSILRKRKMLFHTPYLDNYVGKFDGDSVKDMCSYSIDEKRAKDQLGISRCHKDGGSCESPASHGSGGSSLHLFFTPARSLMLLLHID